MRKAVSYPSKLDRDKIGRDEDDSPQASLFSYFVAGIVGAFIPLAIDALVHAFRIGGV